MPETSNVRLATAWGDLDRATIDYFEARRAYMRGRGLGSLTDEYKAAFDAATFRHEKSSRAFNQEVSATIRATGELPSLAEEVLNHQRYNGFHAKGLAKIVSTHRKISYTEVFLELPLSNQQEKK
jgi:hypothetical protein